MTATTSSTPPSPSSTGSRARAGRFRQSLERMRGDGWGDVLFVPIVIVALGIYLTATTEFFLTSINLTNLLVQGSVLAIVAFGLTFVILAGELDLSVGSSMALVSVISAMVMRDSGSIILGLVVAIGVGLAIGLINGLVVTLLEVPSFIATLGMLTIAGGTALALTDGAVISGIPISIGNLVNEGFIGVRWVLWVVVAVFAILYFIQSQTGFGVRVYAVGGNREASRLSAIPVDRIRLLCFVITGACVGLAGFILVARVQSGQPSAGGLLGLTAIAAIVVGGTNLLGGRGSIARTLFGVLLISVLTNGLQLKGIDDNAQQIIIGVVFIVAASADFVRRQLRKRARRRALDPMAAPQPEASA